MTRAVVCLCLLVYVATSQTFTRQLGNVSVSWDSDSFHVNVTRVRRQFRFSLLADASGVLTMRSDLANATAADGPAFGFPGCTIKNMRCLTGPLDTVSQIFPFFFLPPLSVAASGDNFTVTARVSQQGAQLVNATVTLYYFAATTVLGIRRLSELDVKFDFQVDLPVRACNWQLSTGWPGATAAVVDAREPLAPAVGPAPEEQPDEVFNVSATGGRLRWACAQFARATVSGVSTWGRVDTTAALGTIWMKFGNSSGATSVLMDPTLSVLLQPADLAPEPLPAPPLPPETSAPAAGPNVGLIVGLTVGLTALAVLAVVVGVLVAKRRHREKSLAMSRDLRGRELERADSSRAAVTKV